MAATQSQNGQNPPAAPAYNAPPDWTPPATPPPDDSGSPTPASAQLTPSPAPAAPTPTAAATPAFQAPSKDKPVSTPQDGQDGQTLSQEMWGKGPPQEFTAPQSDQQITDQNGPFVSPENPLPPTDDELNKLDTNTLINRLTNYSDVDSGHAAALLHDRLQQDATTATPMAGGAMLANDLSDSLSKISLNPADWVKGLVGFKNTLGGAANTVMQSLGGQSTLDYRGDLNQQLKQGTITQEQFDSGNALLNQIDDIKAKRALLGPGGGPGETAEHEQELGDEQSNVSRMFFQADPSFAKTQASKALATVLTGTEHSVQSLLAIPQQITDFDPLKYLTGASKMTGWSPDDLKDWINTERLFNVQRLQHAQGQVDPWTHAFANFSNNVLQKSGIWDRNADIDSPLQVDPEKVNQISQAAQALESEALFHTLPMGEITSGLTQAGLKTAGLAVQALPPVARFAGKAVTSKIGRFISTPLVLALNYPNLAHGDISAMAFDAAKEGLTYGGLRVIDKYGPLVADMFERAADNNFKGGGFLSQGLSRGIRLGADAVTNSFPYALLNSGGDPGQFWNNLTTLSAFHGALGAPKTALDTLSGGTGDWLFARDGKVKAVPPRAYGVDPGADAENLANIGNLDPHLQNIVSRTQQAAGDHTDLYILSPQSMQDYQQRFGATAQQTPRGFWVPPEYTGTGRSAAFIDVNHVNDALPHEAMGHPLYWLMDQGSRDAVSDAAIKENDPDQFIKDNYGQNVTYDSLPDNPSRANPNQLSKALIRTEMGVEAIGDYWNGGSIEQFYKNKPSLARALRYGSGAIMDRLGIPSSTWESTTTMGINPAFAPSTLIDGYYRDLLNHRIIRQNVPTNSLGRWPQHGETVTPGGAPPGAGAGGPGGGPAPQQPGPQPQGPGGGPGPQRPAITAGLAGAKPANVLAVTSGPDETVIRGLMKQGFTRQQAIDFAAKGTVSQVNQPPAQPATPPEPTHPADTDAHHAAIEAAIEQGTPAGEAQAAAEGKTPQTLAETGEEPPSYLIAGKRQGPRTQTPIWSPLANVAGTLTGRNLPRPTQQQETPTPEAQTPTEQAQAPSVTAQTPTRPQGPPPAPGPAPGVKAPSGAQKPVPEAPAPAKGAPGPKEGAPQKPTSPGKYTGVIGSEFGEVDNPKRGGYTEPDWNKGKWGDDISGENNRGVALPQSILGHFGNTNDRSFAKNFNSNYEVRIHNPKTGTETTASLKDIGPGKSTGALIDMLWGTRKDLGFDTNFKGAVNFEVVDKKTGQVVYQPTGHEVEEGGGGPISGGGGGGSQGPMIGGGGIGGAAQPFTFPSAQPAAKFGAEVPAMNIEPQPFVGGGGESGGGGAGGGARGEPGVQRAMEEPVRESPAMQQAQYEAYGSGYAPAAPGPSFMPSFMPAKRMGGFQMEREEGEPEEESTLGEPKPKGFEKLMPLLSQGPEGFKQAQKLHSQLLSSDDTRVKKQADNMFKGEHFVQGDPVHTAALANVPTNERMALAAGQTAIANKKPMHLTYASAPPGPGKESPITRASREINYDESSPQARMLGQTNARLAGHSVIPTSIGIAASRKKGVPPNGYVQGISTSVAAHNHHQLNQALNEMGQESPYPELNTAKFRNDLSGYVQNLLAGHRGAGNAYQPGTEAHPANPDKNYVPYRLKQREADFLNAVINNQGARHDPALRELARKGGTLQTEEGETNPLRHAIDVREAGMRQGPGEEIKDKGIKQAAEDRWSKRILEPTIRTFHAGLIHSLHEKASDIPKEIRPSAPGYEELTKVLGRELGGEKGRPDVAAAVNFMPRKPEPLSPEEHAELTGNIRKQFLSGKLRQADYIDRLRDVPEPGQQIGFMPMAGPRATGFGAAQKAGRTFETPLPGGGQRFEINDQDLEFKPASRPYGAPPPSETSPRNALEQRYQNDAHGPGIMPLSDAIRHPELFENYPFLRNTKISTDPTIPHYGHYAPPWLDLEGRPRGDHIVLKSPTDKETLAHEIQHAVQHFEKFAGTGTNPSHIYNQMYNDTGIRQELRKQWDAASEGTRFAGNDQERMSWTERRMKEMANAMYEMEPGEIEARVAGRRALRTTPEAREAALDEIYGKGKAPQSMMDYVRDTTPKEDVLEEMGLAAAKGRQAGTVAGMPGFMPAKGGEFKSATPEEFIAARNKSKRPQFLSPLEPEDIRAHQLYTNPEGTAGAAVSPEGDIQNVFNNGGGRGAGQRALAHAIRNGGRTLDAYDPYLPSLYRQFGFKETGRMKFNRDYAPPNWNFEEDDDPDIAFMAHQGYPPGGEDAAIARATSPPENWLPNERSTQQETDWDQAKERSRNQVSSLAGEAPGPQALGGGEEPRYQAGGRAGQSLGPSFMAAKQPPVSKATQTKLGPRPKDDEQGGLWDQVAARLDTQKPDAIPLEPDRKENGEFKYKDVKGKKIAAYKQEDYALANSPMLQKMGKALGTVVNPKTGKAAMAKAPEGTVDRMDELDPENRLKPYLNPTDRLRLSHLDSISATSAIADKLHDYFKTIEGLPEVMAGKDWYDEAEAHLDKKFGSHKDLVANLLGATSAGTNVKVNYGMAMDAYHQFLRGAYDRHIDLYRQADKLRSQGKLMQHITDNGIHTALGEDAPTKDTEAMDQFIRHHDITPRGAEGKLFGHNSLATLKVLAHTWEREARGPKTPNFAANLSGRSLQATIDMWAARHVHRLTNEGYTDKPWRIQPAAEPGVNNVDFGLSQVAFRKAAERLGYSPKSLQAILWFAEQKHWQDQGWEQEIDPEQRDYRPMLKAYQRPSDITPAMRKKAERVRQKTAAAEAAI